MASMKLIWATGLLSMLMVGVHAQDVEDRFTYPDVEGLVVRDQDVVRVSWETDWTNVNLWVFCMEDVDDSDEPQIQVKQIIEGTQGGAGSERIVINYDTTADECWFNLRNADLDDLGINSVHFAMLANRGPEEQIWQLEEETTTSAAPVSTTTSSATSTTSDATTTEAPVSTTLSSNASEGTGNSDPAGGDGNGSDDDGGLSTGAIAGIAVGIAVVVIGGAIAAFFLLRRRRNARDAAGADTPMMGGTEKYAGQQYANAAEMGAPVGPGVRPGSAIKDGHHMGANELPGYYPDQATRNELPA